MEYTVTQVDTHSYGITNLELDSNEAHVWYASLENRSKNYASIISPAEKIRAQQFRHERDRESYITRHGILRSLLGRYLDNRPEQIRFVTGDNGKPELAGEFSGGKLYFNISYSEGLALFAFSKDHVIGVDLEYMRDIADVDRIAARFYSPGENAVLHSLTGIVKKEAFFRFWTRKEAFTKTIGAGLGARLNEIDTSVVTAENNRIEPTGLSSKEPSIYLYDIDIHAGYKAALATRGRVTEISVITYNDE